MNDKAVNKQNTLYYGLWYIGLLVGVALVFLAVLDIRRGFLFTGATGWWAYQIRGPFGALSGAHAVLVVSGALIAGTCFALLRRAESTVSATVNRRAVHILAVVLLSLLVVDLFTYRGVAAGRALAEGKLAAGWLEGFHWPGWWKPVGVALSYLCTVWHATLLGLLLSGLALVYLPLGIQSVASRSGWLGGFWGTAMAVPQPFCSCCAVAWTPTLMRYGASREFLLAFIVGAPMVNVTTLILAGALLPTSFAILRVAVGISFPVLLAYAVTRLAGQGRGQTSNPPVMVSKPGMLTRRFQSWYERANAPEAPSELVRRWLSGSGRLAMYLVPIMFVVGVVAAFVFEWKPDVCVNNLTGVLVAAVAGTLMMISTWSEIPIAAQLIQAGCYGPAATLLVVLPPVSLPCLAVLAGCMGQVRLVILLAVLVMLAGAVVGVLYM